MNLGHQHPKFGRSPNVGGILTQSWGDPQQFWKPPPKVAEVPTSWGDPHPKLWRSPEVGEIPVQSFEDPQKLRSALKV